MKNNDIKIDFSINIDGETLKNEISIFKPYVKTKEYYNNFFSASMKYIVNIVYTKKIDYNNLMLFIENILLPNGAFDIKVYDSNDNNIFNITCNESEIYNYGYYINTYISYRINIKNQDMINSLNCKEEAFLSNINTFIEKIKNSIIFNEIKNKLIYFLDKEIITKAIKINPDNLQIIKKLNIKY